MKILICYASKTGVTADCALSLSSHLNADVSLCDLNKDNNPSVDGFDLILLGTGVYIGKPHKAFKRFMESKQDQLAEKKTAYYICSSDEAIDPKLFWNKHFPVEATSNGLAFSHFGCEIRYHEMNFLTRFIMKQIVTKNHLTPRLHKDRIVAFAKMLAPKNGRKK